MHSWRVLILPYIEEEQLYKKLHLNEPWDSPHNRAVFDANPMPRIFGCPSQRTDYEDDTKVTNYVMIVGPGTISDGPHSVRPRQITDGEANTILFVEMADSGIHWAEPRDLKADEMSYRINDPDKPSISSHHRGGANVALPMADPNSCRRTASPRRQGPDHHRRRRRRQRVLGELLTAERRLWSAAILRRFCAA